MRLYQFVCMHSKTKAEINLINLIIDTVIRTINRKMLCFQEQMDLQVYKSWLLNFVYDSAFYKHIHVWSKFITMLILLTNLHCFQSYRTRDTYLIEKQTETCLWQGNHVKWIIKRLIHWLMFIIEFQNKIQIF